MVYNKADTPIYKTASRIKATAEHHLHELSQKFTPIKDASEQVGDLEPPLSILHLLLDKDPVQDALDVILSSDPLTSLFSYELGKSKPPPPTKPKRDYRAERERRKRQAELDRSAGFRGQVPRTRRALAAQEAFEAEANASVSESGEGGEQESNSGALDGAALNEEERMRQNRSGKRKRRPPMVLPGQGDVPPVVDDVDNQRSFKMFDEGWILPPNQRRGGRAPIEKHELPPPKKRSRTGECSTAMLISKLLIVCPDRARSTLSFSTPASDNQTLKKEGSPGLPGESEHAEAPPQEDVKEVIEGMEVDPEENGREEVEPEIVNVPRRKTIIIEELDTPATRRAKNMARKQRKLEDLARMRQENGHGSAGPSGTGDDEEGSELSSLSSDEGEEGPQNVRYVRGKKVVSAARAKKAALKAHSTLR